MFIIIVKSPPAPSPLQVAVGSSSRSYVRLRVSQRRPRPCIPNTQSQIKRYYELASDS